MTLQELSRLEARKADRKDVRITVGVPSRDYTRFLGLTDRGEAELATWPGFDGQGVNLLSADRRTHEMALGLLAEGYKVDFRDAETHG